MLDFNGNGIAGCTRCGWRGVPTIVAGVLSTFCPRCEIAASSHMLCDPPSRPIVKAPPRAGRTPRNAPCPCGSGVKHKKCCGA
jgi:hypothetical protein